jgi:Condensation domain
VLLFARGAAEGPTNNGAIEIRNDVLRPLSVAQMAVWLAQQRDPARPDLNLAEHYAVEGALDPHLFTQACRQVVAEFDVYRLAFADTPEGPRQQIRDTFACSPVIRDLRAEPDPELAAKIWMRTDLSDQGEIIGERLFTFALLRIADDRCLFYQRCHRLICDEPSFAMTTARLAALYTGIAAGTPLPFTIQPSALSLVEAEEAYRAGEDFTRDRAFWRERLAIQPEPVNLAGKAGRKAADPPIRRSHDLRRTLVTDLRALATARQTSLTDILTIAVAIYLHRLSGAQVISLKRPVTGRLCSQSHTPV